LFLCFDIGKYFTDTEVRGVIDLSTPQKEQILNQIHEVMQTTARIPSAVWLSGITQLIARVDQPKRLEGLLFMLIRFSVLDYPQATLWNLMSVRNLSSHSERFDVIWEACKSDLDPTRKTALDTYRDRFRAITSDLIHFCGINLHDPKSKVMK
jgi:hypothetical protein